MFRALVAALHVLAVWGLSLEAIHYFDSQTLTDVMSNQDALDGLYIALTVVWAVYGAALIAVGLSRGMRLARWGGMVLVGLAFAKLVVFDSFAIVPNVETYVVAANPKFLAFAVAAVPVAAIGYVYRDADSPSWRSRRSAAFRIAACRRRMWLVGVGADGGDRSLLLRCARTGCSARGLIRHYSTISRLPYWPAIEWRRCKPSIRWRRCSFR